ncbi:RNA ligase family protein [Dactylosporangium sp. NPDC000244]|uniref:RNA ligase family protein n=1 Tax=Dactylosporangium sp. NPDC000244 TaxID=3154365 RepID=UPI003328D900
MTALITERDLRALNSLTKYPSIPTYHALDPKNGGLLEAPTDFGDGTVIATEKVDGTNSRIILLPDGTFLLGSREELLYAQGDLIGNPALGIVEQLKPVAKTMTAVENFNLIIVAYLELYGGKIGGQAKQYTSDPAAFGWRLFDVATFPQWPAQLEWQSQQIASWRDGGGQSFVGEDELAKFAVEAGLPVAPRLLDEFYADALPRSVGDMHSMLVDVLPETRVWLDDKAGGRPEGIVFRTPDRKVIAKARYQDYERTLKRRGGAR